MVDLLHRRTFGTFKFQAILFLIVAAGIERIAGYGRGERLASAMLVRSMQYQWIERSMRNYLQNDPEPDSSFIHVIIHPKVDPRTVQAVLKPCSELKSTVVRMDDKKFAEHRCKSNVTCSKIKRIVGIYEKVDDVDPYGWKNFYGISWNTRAKIAIFLGRGDNRDNYSDKIKFEKTLADFWSMKVVDVVLLVTPWCDNDNNCSDSAKPRVFGYDPFVPVGADKRGKLFERSANDSLFPDKLRNLQGAPIRVSLYHQKPHAVLINNTELGSGMEVNMIRYLSGWMNFTVKLVTSSMSLASYGTRISTGETVGPIGDILNDRSDYVGNADYIAHTFGKKVEFLRSVGRVNRMIIVPHAGRMPGILRIFRGFDARLAGATLLISLGLACYFAAIKKRYPLFNLFRLMMHQQIKGIGKWTSQRIFLIFWIIWAFVISIAIQTQLLKDLADPPFYKNIDTLEELDESSLTLLTDATDVRSLKISPSEFRRDLGEKAVLEPNVSRCIEILKANKNVACVVDASYVDEIVKSVNSKSVDVSAMGNDRSQSVDIVHVAADSLTQYLRTVIVQDGFPYLDKFDNGYFKMIDYGLLEYWFDLDIRHDWEPDRPPMKLGMDHFEGTFKILLIGHCIAFVVFLAEFFSHRVKICKESRETIPAATITVSDRSRRRRLHSIRTLSGISLRAVERL